MGGGGGSKPSAEARADEHRAARARRQTTLLELGNAAESRVRQFNSEGGESGVESRTFYTPLGGDK
jgi:hypothetical protein